MLVFARISGVMLLLPGFGERVIPARVRLGLTVAFALVVWPMLAPELLATDPARPFLGDADRRGRRSGCCSGSPSG